MLPFLAKISNWKFITPLFFLFAWFSFYAFPHYGDQINEIAGEEVKILDLRNGYEYEEVKEDFGKMKEEGREINRFMTGKLDMVYPFSYGLFYLLVLVFLTRTLFGEDSKLIYLSFLPVLLMGIDYIENVNTLKLLNTFPDFTPEQVDFGSQVTQIKQVFVWLSSGLMLVLLLMWGIQRLRGK